MNEDAIHQKLLKTKLETIQLDPYGYCNNSCWFCPRGHMPNPRVYRRHMPLDLMEHILRQFVNDKTAPGVVEGLCAAHLKHVWTGHYNEIVLYRHFEGFLRLLEKFDLCTTILSNGLNYNDANIRQICDAAEKGVVVGICMNIPAGEPTAYQRLTGKPPDVFARMVDGVQRLLRALPPAILHRGSVSIVVNGVDDDLPDQRNLLGPNSPYLPPHDLDTQLNLLTALFPQARVYKVGGLFDRGGHLTKMGVFNHTRLFTKMDEEVVGCTNCGESGGRPFAWAHINPLGELFLCCVDYSFEYTFGSLAVKPLTELWYSKDHVKMLMKAFDGICRTCCSAAKQKRNG